ncbi:MAG: phospholipid/cholesterol/gamma-HCH transport system substrate-binding protein [Myxococcota bacterium]|jgi:phospholipid/cholesterol/gamma-HCH transport system substrate-binding protein
MARSAKQEIGVGALLIVALSLLAFMAVKTNSCTGGRDQLEATVTLTDASGIADGSLIKLAGVDVGTVTGLTVVDGQAQLSLSIARNLGIHQDALVQIRARSVLGEKYIGLSTGTDAAPLLTDGDVLTNTRRVTEIDELVNAMGAVINDIDTKALSAALEAIARALEEDPERAGRMLADAEVILDNMAAASADLPALATSAGETLERVDSMTAQMSPLLRDGRQVMSRLDEATADLPQTADDATAALSETRALISETRTAISHGDELLAVINENSDDIELIIDNLTEIDKFELRRLLREEGIRVRLRSKAVVEED